MQLDGKSSSAYAAPATAGPGNSASSRASASGARNQFENLDVEQLLSILDHSRGIERKFSLEARSLGEKPDPQALSRVNSGLENAQLQVQQIRAEIKKRLRQAEVGARTGDRSAIHTLVTIAWATGFDERISEKAQKVIKRVTNPSPATNAAQGSQPPEAAIAGIRQAISDFRTAYRDTKPAVLTWASEVLQTGKAPPRNVQVLGAIAPSARHAEGQVRSAAATQVSAAAPAGRLEVGRQFDQSEMVPAMRALALASGSRFDVWTLNFADEPAQSSSVSTSFPWGQVKGVSDTVLPAQIAEGVSRQAAASGKPCVTLYFEADHWVAIVAAPPAGPPRIGSENSRSELVVFDSNATIGSKIASQGVGARLADQLNAQGYAVRTVLGAVQEGMASNACGPLCYSAIHNALNDPQIPPRSLSAEMISFRLANFLEVFAKSAQGERDEAVHRAQDEILKAKEDAGRQAPAAASSAAVSSQAPESPASALSAALPSVRPAVRPPSVPIMFPLDGAVDTVCRAVEEEGRILEEALATARATLPPLPGADLLSSLKRSALDVRASFMPEAPSTQEIQRQRQAEADRVSETRALIRTLEQLKGMNKRRFELAVPTDRLLRQWANVSKQAASSGLPDAALASRAEKIGREYLDTRAQLDTLDEEYKRQRQAVTGASLGALPMPGPDGAFVVGGQTVRERKAGLV